MRSLPGAPGELWGQPGAMMMHMTPAARRSSGGGTARAGRDERRPPVIPADLDGLELEGLADHDGWSERAITGSAVAADAEHVEIARGTVRGVRFTAAQLRRAEFTDLVVSDCDFSGAVLEEFSANRVSFEGCRFDGADLGGASLIDVSFSQCQMNDLGLRMVRAERLSVSDSSAVGIDLYRAWLNASRWHDCDLTGAQLSGAHFERARLHGSTIADVRGASALKDSVIDPQQTIQVGLALMADAGIEVDDAR